MIRLVVTRKYRLLEQGLIEEPATGEVDFALPTLRDFVLERTGNKR